MSATTVWPDSLKAYVGRCFETALPLHRPEMERSLKQLIFDSIENNTLWSTDWDRKPLLSQEPEVQASDVMDVEEDQLEKLRKDVPVKTASNREQVVSKNASKRSAKWDQVNKPIQFEISKKKKTPANKDTDQFQITVEDNERKQKRAKRFELDSTESTPPLQNIASNSSNRVYITDTEPETFVGRCMKLEKKYLRLTSAPDPDTVRPLHVLRNTLELLKQKWKLEQNYAYICDQFKSLRQDLTVQHIQNEFTVNVYEIHARIALERSDLGEYNQCQTQLRSLYASGVQGHATEFLAYRILYLLHTRNKSDMNDLLTELTDEEKADPAVKHALQVRTAMTDQDYHSLMRLYVTAPNMGGYVMDSFVERERLAALEIICKAFRPDISLRFLTDELGFESDISSFEFLTKYAMHIYVDADSLKLKTKEAYPQALQNRIAAFKKIDIKGQI
ncbi:SAC3/GANP/Nin1/mts3/eIF-3 p25 family-domain-containing protein [Lipomyces japonicus]|uniref:SAC3/GANP/Nin1/mts3/eIF-3 p25 family-domain-containing protein n=1 Tax=Lipomyces japonicus TaxID=56871 RepID=UPI0034CD2F18